MKNLIFEFSSTPYRGKVEFRFNTQKREDFCTAQPRGGEDKTLRWNVASRCRLSACCHSFYWFFLVSVLNPLVLINPKGDSK
jgi:hypothetical protein